MAATTRDQKEAAMKSPGWKINKRSIYALVGWSFGMVVGLLLYYAWRPYELFLTTLLPFVGMVSALWYGETTNKIPSADELNAPIALFPKDNSTKGP
jgi:hypothetical protein